MAFLNVTQRPVLFTFNPSSFTRGVLGTLVLIAITLFLPARVAFAAVDINGVFSGPLSEPGFLCTYQQYPNPPYIQNVTFNLIGTNGNFTGTIIHDEGLANTQGTYDASGNINGTLSELDKTGKLTTGSYTGALSGNTLTLSGTLSEPDCDTHSFSATLTRTAGPVVSPLTPSSVATAQILLNSQVTAITKDVSVRVGDALRGTATGPRKTASGFMYQASGLNAGDKTATYGAWGSYSYSDFGNKFTATAFDGKRHNALVGLDMSPWNKSVLGLAVGYESSDIDTRFNQGNQETAGFTVAPYIGWLFSDHWSVDASAGYSRVDSDQYRTDPATGARVTSAPTADRWFGALNINGFTTHGNWLFGGRVGLLYARNVQEAFVESNGVVIAQSTNTLEQWNVGGDVAYGLGDFKPFARVTYEKDFSATEIAVAGGGPPPSNDTDNFLVGIGVRYFGKNGLTGNLEWNRRLGREDFNEDSLTATLRVAF